MNVAAAPAVVSPPAHRKLHRGLPSDEFAGRSWKLSTFRGRFAEISGSHATAALTLAFRLVLEAQRQKGLVAWITRRESSFYPPDAAELAVDLSSLPVVWAPTPEHAARAADQLLRSGAFRLVVLDLGDPARQVRSRSRRHGPLSPQAQTRLMGLAKKHDTALLCITEKDGGQPSLGSLVSIRAEAARVLRLENSRDDGFVGGIGRQLGNTRYRLEARVIKDKRRGPGWSHREVCHGPPGLC